MSNIDIKAHLYNASKHLSEFAIWARLIKVNLAETCFMQAYYYFYNGQRLAAYKALLRTLKIRFSIAYLRFSLRMLFPRGEQKE